MKAVAIYDRNYGISRNGEAPMKIATMRRKYAKMFKGNAVVMNMAYFRLHGIWDDDAVDTIVVDDELSVDFYALNGFLGDIKISTKKQDETPYYQASHINALFNYEIDTEKTIYVIGNGEFISKMAPFCEKFYGTMIGNEFEDMTDFAPKYIDECPKAWSMVLEIERRQFKTVYYEREYDNLLYLGNPITDIYYAGSKRIIAILGETNSGKDTTVNKLMEALPESIDVKPVVSYTDRSIRPFEEEGVQHKFIDNKMAEYCITYCKPMIAAETSFSDSSGNTYHYFTLLQDLSSYGNIYVIDPPGLEDLENRLRDIFGYLEISSILIDVPAFIRNWRARKRLDWNKKTYTKRVESEKTRFDHFRNQAQFDGNTTYVYKNYGFNQSKKFEELVHVVKCALAPRYDD